MNYQSIKDQFDLNIKQAEIATTDFINHEIKNPLTISYTESGEPIHSDTINYVIGFQLTHDDKYQFIISATNFTGTLKMTNQITISDKTMMVQEIIAKYQKYLSIMLAKLDLALYKVDYDALSQFSNSEFDLLPLTIYQLVNYIVNHWEQYVFYSKHDLLKPILKSDQGYNVLVNSLLKISPKILKETANSIINVLRYGLSHHLCTNNDIKLTQQLLNKLDLNNCLLSMSAHRELLRLLLSEPKLTTDFTFNVNDLMYLNQNIVIASLNKNTSSLKFKMDPIANNQRLNFKALMSLDNHPQIEYIN